MALDLNDLKSVREFAAAFKAKNLPLHILICNAGIMAIKERTLTAQKIESQFGVNHVAHHLLVTLLLDVVKKSAPSRIVVLSSLAHVRSDILWDDINQEKKYDKWVSYGQSKTANILFARHLNSMLAKDCKDNARVEVFAVHPGGIHSTNLGANLDEKDMEMLKARKYRWKTIEQGASSTVVAATSPALDGKGGAYIVDCNEAKSAAHCNNMENAKKLWDYTEKLIQ